MKKVTIDANDGKYYGFENVSDVSDFDDFTQIKVVHPDGMVDIHKIANGTIQRISYYNANGLPVPVTKPTE